MAAEHQAVKKPCGICALAERIAAGNLPGFIAEMPRSYVVLGDAQFYRGYCILSAKRHVTELFLMPAWEAHALYDELLATAQALANVLKPWKINYECLGNSEPHVHWHIFPRYENDALRHAPVWVRPETERVITLEPDDRHVLIRQIRTELSRQLSNVRYPAD